MRNLLPLLIILACPLMMIFMMRGMHGGNDHDQQQHTPDPQARSPFDPTSEDRIAELEREVEALREQARTRDNVPASPR